ncbi:MAG TPA: type II toxin-antitoxin system death-on-curing family toxin [Chloroflexi bacterium]|nr:type II toxin-antitoxin system death-on-curing family toxin [Chloroflexota bacterium]
MTTERPAKDDTDVVGRLLVRVYEIHERVLAKGGGGLGGIRDAAMLHAAVARPFATFGGVELYPTDFDKAAALSHSLIKSHPFMDGTKRTAFASAIYFLNERGYVLQGPLPKDEVIHFCVEVAEEARCQAEGKPVEGRTIAEIAEWFRGLVEGP